MTTEERLDALERELTRATRNNRWLLTAAGVIVVMLVLAWTSARTTPTAQAQAADTGPEVIRATAFILLDERDKPRAVLSMAAGEPALIMSDKTGKPRAVLTMDNGGPTLGLTDETGTGRVGLAVTKDGPVLGLMDENGTIRAGLTVIDDRPTLVLFDERGNIIWSAP